VSGASLLRCNHYILEVHSLEEEVTQAELDAVDEDISAVYIIRAILKRAEALKISKFEAMAQIPDGNEINEELNTKPKVPTELHAQQTLKKAKVRKTEEEKVRLPHQ
jgi:hypothetical protein